MFEILQNTLFRARRAAQTSASGASGTAAPSAQEMPTSRPAAHPQSAVLARLAPAARTALRADFASLNAHEGRLVPIQLRPSGVLWRIHPAPASEPSAVPATAATAGAAVALGFRGAHP